MSILLSPLKFSNSEGSLKKLRELRHKFRNSPTALSLTQYAKTTGVILSDQTDFLKKKGWGGLYEHQGRVVFFRRGAPYSILVHEFRHVQQDDVLERERPEYLKNYMSFNDVMRDLMFLVIKEADACYFEHKAKQEDGLVKPIRGEFFLRKFIRYESHRWTSIALGAELNKGSLRHLFTDVVLASCVDMLDDWTSSKALVRLNKKIPLSPVKPEQYKADLNYLGEVIDLICRDEDGTNYVFGEESAIGKRAILQNIWNEIFTPEVQNTIHYIEQRKLRLEDIQAFGTKMFNTALHLPYCLPRF